MELPSVTGAFDMTHSDFERACLIFIHDELEKPSPDNTLIGVLCNAVRLSREWVDDMARRFAKVAVQEGPQKFLERFAGSDDDPRPAPETVCSSCGSKWEIECAFLDREGWDYFVGECSKCGTRNTVKKPSPTEDQHDQA